MMKHSFFRKTSISLIYFWLGILGLLPLVLTFITSFLSHTDSTLITFHFSLGSYKELLNYVYLRIFLQSLVLAGLCTFFCLLIGYPAAFILARLKTRLKPLLLVLVIIPFWTSALVRTYAMIAILKTHGLLNQLLLSIGIIHHPLQMLYTTPAVLIGCVYNLLPYMILPLYANIEKLDNRYIEAARDLGASKVQLFKKVILPLTTPGMLAGSLLVFLPAMTLFYIPVLLGGAKSLLLGNLIQMQFLDMRDWPGGAATSVALTVLMLLMIAVYRHIARDRANEAIS